MNDQAKLLLSAYRPSGADAGDPAFAEALAQAGSDPQLRAWLDESRRFDDMISEKLRSVAVPQNLRAMILAGAKLSRPRRWWSDSRVWALAAALAVFASAFAFWRAQNSRLDVWQVDSLAVLDNVLSEKAKLDVQDSRPAQLVRWLGDHTAPVPSEIPLPLAMHESLGCKKIESHGRIVSLICFDLGDKKLAHLFTTPRAGLKLDAPDKHPIFAHRAHWNLASWSSGDEVHMLATQLDEAHLRALLPDFVAAEIAPARAMLADFPRAF